MKLESEKIIERKLVSEVKARHGLCIKLLCDQLIGLPDRLCLFPGHKAAFVEVKSQGQKPRRIQAYMHAKLRSLGFRVEVIDRAEQITDFINAVLYE